MSNIDIRKQNSERPATTSPADVAWDPWHQLRALLAWDPFRDVAPFPYVGRFAEREVGLNPAFDIKETKDAYLFKADLPGVRNEDLQVTVTGNRLTVSGKREQEKEQRTGRYHAYERHYGSFTRSFALPEAADIDQLGASLEQGVLSIQVPKRAELLPKKIAVKSEADAAKS